VPRARQRRRDTDELTPREEVVVKLVAEAHTNDEIGEFLHISKKPSSATANVLEKLGR
jgi:DNA-binding CsgD family transcriptional regulator